MSSTEINLKRLGEEAYDLPTLISFENNVFLKHFDTKVAAEIGLKAKELAEKEFPDASAAIDVAYTTGVTLFRICIGDIQQENEFYIGQKKAAVNRFGTSSWYFYQKCHKLGRVDSTGKSTNGDPLTLAGGSVPIRLEGAKDFVLATITISGLKNHEDHYLSLSALKAVAAEQQKK